MERCLAHFQCYINMLQPEMLQEVAANMSFSGGKQNLQKQKFKILTNWGCLIIIFNWIRILLSYSRLQQFAASLVEFH